MQVNVFPKLTKEFNDTLPKALFFIIIIIIIIIIIVSHLHSLSEPHGTLLTLAADVTLCTMVWSFWHIAPKTSFSLSSFIPISFPAKNHNQKQFSNIKIGKFSCFNLWLWL